MIAETLVGLEHTVLDARGRRIFSETAEARLQPIRGPLLDLAELRAAGRLTVRRDAGLGDCLMILPGLRAVREAAPGVHISFEAPRAYTGLLERFREVDAALPLERARGRAPEVFANLSGFVERHPEAWRRDRIDLFAEALGVAVSGELPGYCALKSDLVWAREWIGRRLPGPLSGVVGLALRGIYRHRSWPMHNVYRLAEMLVDAGVGVIMFDGEREAPRMPHRGAGVAHAYGLPLEMVAALVVRCDAVVSPDTGLLHLAGMLRVPTAGIFGAVHPDLRTKHYRRHVSLIAEELPCVPCCEGPRHSSCEVECMAAIAPEMVWERLRALGVGADSAED